MIISAVSRLPALLSIVGLSALLGGCASYSNIVNSFGPERPRSDLRASVEAPLEISDKPSPFCHIPSETYIVMPEDGRVGKVLVTFIDGNEVLLEGDYSGMTLSGSDSTQFKGNQEQLDEMFGATMAALPPAPYHATLYFLLDKDELTAESKQKAIAVFDDITRRQIAEIIIQGHTDTAASFAYNETLSEKRAMKVRQALIDLGIAPALIKTKGLGEYQLLVETPDSTPEPLNRRVEIDVR